MGFVSRGAEAGTAASLADIIRRENPAGTEFLFLSGDKRRNDLISSLVASGIIVNETMVYQTEPSESISQDISITLENTQTWPKFIVFFSPSGVDATLKYLETYEWWPRCICVAIGSTTAKYLSELKLKNIVIAHHPTPDGVLAALGEFEHEMAS